MTKEERYEFTTDMFKVVLAGLSRDLHTNRWNITSLCCNHQYNPITTMYRWQRLKCKCGKEQVVDYNDGKAIDPPVWEMEGLTMTV